MGRIFETRKHVMFARWNRMAKQFTRIGKDITIAVKAAGPDPDNNPTLRRVIQNARSVNMPKDKVEAAIKRVHAGTYGICESTQKPIAKERLLAVPFTRYSTEAKKQVERHSHRSVERGGLFGDGAEEDGGKMSADDDGGE